MTGLYNGPVITEEDDLFDSSPTDSLTGNLPRRRARSGSCSEFVFNPLRTHSTVPPSSPKPTQNSGDGEAWHLLR